MNKQIDREKQTTKEETNKEQTNKLEYWLYYRMQYVIYILPITMLQNAGSERYI